MSRNPGKKFFSRPDEFSFKDFLAAMFVAAFLYFSWRALCSETALDLVRALVPLIGIILGGYFGQEAITVWANRPVKEREEDHNSYGPYV